MSELQAEHLLCAVLSRYAFTALAIAMLKAFSNPKLSDDVGHSVYMLTMIRTKSTLCH